MTWETCVTLTLNLKRDCLVQHRTLQLGSKNLIMFLRQIGLGTFGASVSSFWRFWQARSWSYLAKVTRQSSNFIATAGNTLTWRCSSSYMHWWSKATTEMSNSSWEKFLPINPTLLLKIFVASDKQSRRMAIFEINAISLQRLFLKILLSWRRVTNSLPHFWTRMLLMPTVFHIWRKLSKMWKKSTFRTQLTNSTWAPPRKLSQLVPISERVNQFLNPKLTRIPKRMKKQENAKNEKMKKTNSL